MASSTPRLASDSDAALDTVLLAAQGGDASAFATIYSRFARAVHGVVLGHCPREDAEDVTQEVFLLIQRKLDTVEDANALGGWICRVARNAAIDHARKCMRRPASVELGEHAVAAARSDESLAEQMLARLCELPEAYRETLALRLVEGLTGPEIASATGMTSGSVRVNLHRGMELLRERLRKDGWP